ncbi:MAG TPA: DNA-directed RNA polymerase subunit omega [Clostridiales bacterium]|nr:DNA-directed RNA polymerase subunit omega [Clostridiales bacterium]
MLHPSYNDLMNIVNSEVEPGEELLVNSRYSIVIATAKRARQLILGATAKIESEDLPKPLSIAVQELFESKVKIISDEEEFDNE